MPVDVLSHPGQRTQIKPKRVQLTYFKLNIMDYFNQWTWADVYNSQQNVPLTLRHQTWNTAKLIWFHVGVHKCNNGDRWKCGGKLITQFPYWLTVCVFRIFTAYKETNVEYLANIKYAHTVVQIPESIITLRKSGVSHILCVTEKHKHMLYRRGK